MRSKASIGQGCRHPRCGGAAPHDRSSGGPGRGRDSPFEAREFHRLPRRRSARARDELASLAGRYRSDEIGTVWTVSILDGMLVVTGPIFEEPATLETAIEGEYSITRIGASVRFTHDRRGRATGFALTLDGLQGVRFDRLP